MIARTPSLKPSAGVSFESMFKLTPRGGCANPAVSTGFGCRDISPSTCIPSERHGFIRHPIRSHDIPR